MALQNFIDKVGPVVSAAWLNVVDVLKFTVFEDAATKAQARAALTSDAGWSKAQGGTGNQLGYAVDFGTFGPTATLASNSTTNLGGVANNPHVISVTGTVTITSFGSSADTAAPIYLVKFASSLTINNSAALALPGGANLTVNAGDTLLAEYLGSGNWKVWAVWTALTGKTVGTFGAKVSVASAATTDLGNVSGQAHVIEITGTTGISSFGSNASTAAPIYIVSFTASLTLTGGSGITLPYGESSIQTKANDQMLVQYTGSGNWTVLGYLRKSYVPTIRNVAGTTDSPTAVDADNLVTLSSASATVVTLNGGVIPVGSSIAFFRLGSGTVTFAAGASQTVNSPGSRLTIPEQYGTVVATYRATNTWILGGV